ncbi:MAG: DUF2207 domain-containing protein [Chthonomonadetes bacterium]|nr:DUF2207 domain-containing protein [Chthonomonadetes bacterium]
MRNFCLAALCVVLLWLATTGQAKEYDHPLIVQTYRLTASGDAEVEEVRTFRFSGSFSWANLKRSTQGQYGRYGIEYLGVWDADTREPLRYSQTTEGEYAVLRWEYQAKDTTRRFRLRYRIRNAVQRYSDVAQFYWKAIEDEHAPLEQMQITILPPSPSPKLFKVFVHSKAAPGRLQIEPDFSRARIEQRDIPTDSYVEVRAMLDPAIFPQASMQAENRYEAFLEEERRFAERELREAQRRARIARVVNWWINIEIPIALALSVGLVGYLVVTYRRYGREPEIPEIEYEREPPRDLPPAVVPAILTQSKAEPAQVIKGFSATVLEAARLGYLSIEETQTEGLLGTGLFRRTERRYVLTPEGKSALMGVAIQSPVRKGRPLEEFERKALRILLIEAGDGNAVTESELRKWAEKTVGSKTQMLRFIEGWGKELRRWFEKQYFRLDDPQSESAKKRYLIHLAILGGAGSVLTFPVSLFTLLPVSVVVAIIAAVSLSRRSPEAAREYQRWDAFKRFMTDFSAMREAGPELLPLWERYLVYAVSLGVAQKLIHNLALLAQEYDYSLSHPAWYHTASGATFSTDSLSGMTNFVENLQNLTSALSSSTSSGGGFSGGGGGGGGGGSSGAG